MRAAITLGGARRGGNRITHLPGLLCVLCASVVKFGSSMLNKKNITLFSLAFLITLLVKAPASLMDAWASQATNGVVSLSNPAGTLWSGSATPVLNFKQGAPFPLERMEWNISFRSILSGAILLQLRESAAPQKPPAEIYFGFRQVELRNIAIELPAATMGELNPLLRAMRFQGQVGISTDNLVLQRSGAVTGKASANWQMAGSTLSPVNPFGNYRFDLSGVGDKVQINLSTVSGDLQLNGQGEWLTTGKLSFQTTAKAVGASKEVFSEMLHHLGPETEPGVFLFKLGS